MLYSQHSDSSRACGTLFLAQPKEYQAKYAKIAEDVEEDTDKVHTFFEGCHVEDVVDIVCFKS